MSVAVAKKDALSRTILQFVLIIWSNVRVAKTIKCLEKMIIKSFLKNSLKGRLIFKHLGR